MWNFVKSIVSKATVSSNEILIVQLSRSTEKLMRVVLVTSIAYSIA